MCAIAGILDLECTMETQANMLSTMLRRGPDGTGYFCDPGVTLLHARLAVIDPQGGGQPMRLSHAGEDLTIVYNGELYNTPELRRVLEGLGHHFKTRCDTEVLLHAYAQWGQGCLDRLNGIYAFAIWDKKRKLLFLARDRMGVKPLFFTRYKGGLLFASEIKTLLAYPGVEPILTQEGVAEILLIGPGRSPGCGIFHGIEELEPGCCGFYRQGNLQIRRYWKLTDREHRETFEETAEQVRFLVLDAIRRQTVSDVPIGTFLSGGLDSSLISAVCARSISDLPTFSVDYQDNDRYFIPSKFQPNSDSHYIQIMKDALSCRHHLCMLTPQQLMADLQNAVIARDLPGMADVDISLLSFCREIRKEVTVAISGECADEIFGGYPWYRDPEIRQRAGFPWAQNILQRKSMLHPEFRQKLRCEDYVQSRYQRTCAESDILPDNSPQERRMKEMVNLNVRWFMQTLLERKDRMSMFSSLEVRVPFCDHRIAEYLYAVPWEYKDHRNQEKGLLRYAMAGILPEEVLWRKKSPYPKTFDPLYLELVSRELKQLLEQKDAPVFQLVDRKTAQNLLDTEFAWPWYGQLMNVPQTICYLLQINFWLQQYHVRLAN